MVWFSNARGALNAEPGGIGGAPHVATQGLTTASVPCDQAVEEGANRVAMIAALTNRPRRTILMCGSGTRFLFIGSSHWKSPHDRAEGVEPIQGNRMKPVA